MRDNRVANNHVRDPQESARMVRACSPPPASTCWTSGRSTLSFFEPVACNSTAALSQDGAS